jgi:hypothetical protein
MILDIKTLIRRAESAWMKALRPRSVLEEMFNSVLVFKVTPMAIIAIRSTKTMARIKIAPLL